MIGIEPTSEASYCREADAAVVDRVMSQRFANRFFTDRPVGAEIVRAILDVARYAPSGGNTQPWRVYAVGGQDKERLSARMVAEHARNPSGHKAEYCYYPDNLPALHNCRKNQWGADFYSRLGIQQSDQEGRQRQTARNFQFFDAPIGLIFTIHRGLEKGSWLDMGMFLQNVMLASKVRGLDTCPQESLARYHNIMREYLPIGEDELVVCGMSLGFPERAQAGPGRAISRVPVDEIASFHGL